MVQTSNLFFSYTGSPPYVLNGISLEISNGDYVLVVSGSGCDEGTLMRLILKFMKPTGGAIELKAKRVGYVPQKNDLSSVNFPITVSEMLHSYRGLLKIEGRSVVVSGVAQIGMGGFENALVGMFSGGQGQKILIAWALLRNPNPLILDESSIGVNMESQKEIYGFLRKLNRKKGVTIVSIEHNLNAATANSMLLYRLVAGRGHLCTPEQYIKEYLHGEKEDESNVQL